MLEEVWKVVPSLPEYEASSLGRVRRVQFYKEMPYGGKRCYGGVPITGVLRKDKMRYFIMDKNKNYAIHRMVCEAFHGKQPKPYPHAIVSHLNENQLDNRACNLAWRSQKENLNDAKIKKYHRSRIGVNNPYIKGRAKKAAVQEG